MTKLKVETKAKKVKKVKKVKKEAGRPETKIDWEQFDKLCMLQCTQKEIASFFDCTDETIQNLVKKYKNTDFSVYYAQKSQKGKIAIRRKQFQVAESGNTTMLIWLGQNWLSQSNRETISETEKEIKVNIQVVDDKKK